MAAHMLLVWLLALTTGIVNACIVEPGSRPAAIPASHQHHDATRHHEHAADALAGGHSAPHADKAACAKFCDDKSASLPSGKPGDPIDAVLFAPPPTGFLAVQEAQEAVGAFHAGQGLPPPRVAIPIAFLRLTL